MALAQGHNRKYAFNMGLYGTEFPAKEDHVFFRVEKWTSRAAHSKTRETDTKTTPEEQDLTRTNDDVELALWVGMRPAKAEFFRHKQATPVDPNDDAMQTVSNMLQAGKIKKGTSVDNLGSLEALPILPSEEGATRIAVKFAHQERLQFYELINRDKKSRLCTAIPVPIADVFFLPPYRVDSVATTRDRETEWPDAIKAYIADQVNKNLSSTGFRPPRSTARIDFDERASNLLDIQGLINQFAVSGADWILDEVEKIIVETESDFKGHSTVNLVSIHRLLDLDGTFVVSDAEHLVPLVEKCFPRLAAAAQITPSSLVEYGDYIRRTESRVTYSALRAHLGAYFMYQRNFQKKTERDGEPKTYDDCKDWMDANIDFMAEEPPRPPPQFAEVSSDIQLWLKSHYDIMEKIVTKHKENMDAVINWHGTALCGDNLWQIWENVGESPDTDGAQQFALQAMRFTAREMVAKSDVTTRNLDSYMKLIKQNMVDTADGEEDTSPIEEESRTQRT